MSLRKGFAHERDLVRRLWEHGFAAVRAPASGSRTKRIVYPDVVAIHKGKVIVMEVKIVGRERTIYIDRKKVEKLREFASRAGASAYVAVKIVGTGEWLFVPLELLVEAENSYKLTRDALSRAIDLKTLVTTVKGVKKLTEFQDKKASEPT